MVARQGVEDRPDPVDYAAWWNEFGVLSLQLELVEAITRARNLARSGVDIITFGPIDMMFSCKAHPHHFLKTMDDCVAYVVKALEGTGIAVCVSTELLEKYGDMGVSVFQERPRDA